MCACSPCYGYIRDSGKLQACSTASFKALYILPAQLVEGSSVIHLVIGDDDVEVKDQRTQVPWGYVQVLWASSGVCYSS